MAVRRSNRRVTITGSSVFSASTPMIPPVAIKESASNENEDASPKWVSAEEAFGGLRTPKFTKMTRRTTLTRQNIFDDETIVGGAALDMSGFKAPRFFIPVSPPGVKTRSRRSSMMMGPPQPAKVKKVTKATGKKTNSNVDKSDTKVTRKSVSRRTSSVMPAKEEKPAPIKVTSRRSVAKRGADDGGDMEFTSMESMVLSPILDIGNKSDVKKSRRSIRHQYTESEASIMSSESGALLSHDFQTPRTHIPQGVEQRQTENQNLSKLSRRSMPAMTPKASVASSKTPQKSVSPKASATPKASGKSVSKSRTVSKTPQSDYRNVCSDAAETSPPFSKTTSRRAMTPTLPPPMSPSRSTGLKRQVSKEETDEIEQVVKKMFTPQNFYSTQELSYKQKHMSPTSGKAVSSPARTAILREEVNTGRKSPARNVRITQTTATTPKTPSRAAPKAKKILGVSMNAAPLNNNANTQSRALRSVVENNEGHNMDESMLSVSKSENVSFTENENNVTLSHTSHSQWCTIL